MPKLPPKKSTATCPIPILTYLFIFSRWSRSQYGNWAGTVFIFCWRALIWSFNEQPMRGKKPTNRLYLHDRSSRVLFSRLLSWYGLFVGFVTSGSLEFDNVKRPRKLKLALVFQVSATSYFCFGQLLLTSISFSLWGCSVRNWKLVVRDTGWRQLFYSIALKPLL